MKPVNFDVLNLPSLNEADLHGQTRAAGSTTLSKLLNAIRIDGTRGIRLSVDNSGAKWTTSQIAVTARAKQT